MRLPKLLNADYEQSLNLLDDGLVSSYHEWEEEQKQTRCGVVGSIIFILIAYGPIWLASIMSGWAVKQKGYAAEFDFLPQWLGFAIMGAFLVLAYGNGLKNRGKYMETYNGKFTMSSYFMLLLLAANLLFATLFFPIIKIYGVIGGFVIVVIIIVGMFRSKAKKLTINLYDLNKKKWENHFMKKFLNFKLLVRAGAVLVSLYYVFKFTFPDVVRGLRSSLPILVFGWLLCNILISLFVIHLFFPAIIQGYYRKKYAEEYRKREGKTQIQWYGEKYFNKYIKGTEKEDKIK